MKEALVIILVLSMPAVVLGDLLIEEEVSSRGAMGMWDSRGTETTYIKGDKVRTDSKTTVKGMMEAMMPKPEVIETHIIRLDKGIIWSMQPEESTYTEMSVEDMGGIGGDVESTMGVREISLSRTGDTREIAGYECEGILIEALIDVESQGRAMTMDADALFWAAKEDKKLKELMKLWEGMMGLMDVQESGGLGSGMRALWDKFNEIEGVPLAMELTVDSPEGEDEEQTEEMRNAMRMMREYMRGAGKEVEEEEDQHFMVVTREVVSLEEATHDDAIFEIPKGFTKIRGR